MPKSENLFGRTTARTPISVGPTCALKPRRPALVYWLNRLLSDLHVASSIVTFAVLFQHLGVSR